MAGLGVVSKGPALGTMEYQKYPTQGGWTAISVLTDAVLEGKVLGHQVSDLQNPVHLAAFRLLY